MRNGFRYRENLQTNMWLLPSVFSTMCALLACICVYVDLQYDVNTKQTIGLDIASARTTLSTIATAAVTITSVTFSITVLTLSLAANQLGQRLMPNFMRQVTTQITLGFFLGTFIYTMLILHAISIFAVGQFIPFVSVTVGVILGILCLALLLYFIHFITHVIQIDNVLEFLLRDMLTLIDNVFDEQPAASCKPANYDELTNKPFVDVTSTNPGYIMMIDYEKILEIAKANDHFVEVNFIPGKYVYRNMPLMRVYPQQGQSAKSWDYASCVVMNNYRTTIQDVEFIFEEYCEIGLKALSPAVNNPYTTIHCIDRINEGICHLASKNALQDMLYDENNQLRIKREVITSAGIIATAYHRLRQSAAMDMSVAIHMIISLQRIIPLGLPKRFVAALAEQAELLMQGEKSSSATQFDQDKLKREYNTLLAIIASQGAVV